MLYQNPRMFSAEECVGVVLWKANPQIVNVVKKDPYHGFKGNSGNDAVLQKEKRKNAFCKNLSFIQDRNELILCILEENKFSMSYADLWKTVLSQARKMGFNSFFLSEEYVKTCVSIVLKQLFNRKIIKFENFGENIRPDNLSELHSFRIASEIEIETQNEAPEELEEDTEEPDFNDPEVIAAELSKEKERKKRGLPSEGSYLLKKVERNEDDLFVGEEEDFSVNVEADLPESIKNRLREIVQETTLDEVDMAD